MSCHWRRRMGMRHGPLLRELFLKASPGARQDLGSPREQTWVFTEPGLCIFKVRLSKSDQLAFMDVSVPGPSLIVFTG